MNSKLQILLSKPMAVTDLCRSLESDNQSIDNFKAEKVSSIATIDS
jgi:hypothetical protein